MSGRVEERTSEHRHLTLAHSFLPSAMNGLTPRPMACFLVLLAKVISGIIFERDNPNTRARREDHFEGGKDRDRGGEGGD